MTKYQVAFFDVDGTLTDNRKNELSLVERIPNSTLVAIQELKKKGIQSVIATGRDRLKIQELIACLSIPHYVTSNGLKISYNHKSIATHLLVQSDVEQIMTQLDLLPFEYHIETERGVLTKSEFSTFEGETNISSQILQFIVYADEQHQSLELGQATDRFQAVRVGPTVFNVLPKNHSKASGIEEMLRLINVPKEATIAFGDAENDLPMFDAVGTTVAMGNACSELKQKANVITDCVWEDGIYNACKRQRGNQAVFHGRN